MGGAWDFPINDGVREVLRQGIVKATVGTSKENFRHGWGVMGRVYVYVRSLRFTWKGALEVCVGVFGVGCVSFLYGTLMWPVFRLWLGRTIWGRGDTFCRSAFCQTIVFFHDCSIKHHEHDGHLHEVVKYRLHVMSSPFWIQHENVFIWVWSSGSWASSMNFKIVLKYLNFIYAEAWIITNGINVGVAKYVAEAVKESKLVSKYLRKKPTAVVTIGIESLSNVRMEQRMMLRTTVRRATLVSFADLFNYFYYITILRAEILHEIFRMLSFRHSIADMKVLPSSFKLKFFLEWCNFMGNNVPGR